MLPKLFARWQHCPTDRKKTHPQRSVFAHQFKMSLLSCSCKTFAIAINEVFKNVNMDPNKSIRVTSYSVYLTQHRIDNGGERQTNFDNQVDI